MTSVLQSTYLTKMPKILHLIMFSPTFTDYFSISPTNRIAAQLTNQLYQSASLSNAPVTMAIIQYGTVRNAITIVTINVVVVITLFIRVYRQHGKWTRKCKLIWLKQ